MKPADLNLNRKLLKVLEEFFTAVGEALIEQKMSPTPALKKAHKKSFRCPAQSIQEGSITGYLRLPCSDFPPYWSRLNGQTMETFAHYERGVGYLRFIK